MGQASVHRRAAAGGEGSPGSAGQGRGGADGRVLDGETPGRMYVTLPDEAVAAMRTHGSVKYLQRIAMPDDPLVWPDVEARVAVPQSGAAGGPRPIGTDRLRVAPEGFSAIWRSGEYRYDGSGNIIAVGTTAYPAFSGAANTYTYDQLSRLVTANVSSNGVSRSESYTYDVYGNMTTLRLCCPRMSERYALMLPPTP